MANPPSNRIWIVTTAVLGIAWLVAIPQLLPDSGSNAAANNPAAGSPDEHSAHVADVEASIRLLEGAREAYLDGKDLRAHVEGTHEFAADGHVNHPYMYVWLLPEKLDGLTVEDFTSQSEYFAHPFQTLGPINHPVHKEDSAAYAAFQTDLDNARTKHDGYVWTVNYNFHSKQSHTNDGAHFEDDHRKEFLRLLLDGRGPHKGRRFILSAGFAETGVLGPTQSH